MNLTIKQVIKILALPRTVLWTNRSLLEVTALGALITTAITDVFPPHILSNCSVALCCFSSFLCSLLPIDAAKPSDSSMYHCSPCSPFEPHCHSCLSGRIWSSTGSLLGHSVPPYLDLGIFRYSCMLSQLPGFGIPRTLYPPASHTLLVCSGSSLGASLHSLHLGSGLLYCAPSGSDHHLNQRHSCYIFSHQPLSILPSTIRMRNYRI